MNNVYFCAKRILDNKWVFGYLIKSNHFDTFIYEKNGEVFKVWNYTVSMFTGRYDTKHKEIFENAIVEEENFKGLVKYCKEEAKFVLESGAIISDLGNRKVMVIGNIFDAPELLEKNK